MVRRANSEILDRQPPRSLEAERGVLGSILLMPDACDDVALVLRPEHFYDDANRKIYSHIVATYDAGQRIDTTLLAEHMRTAGDLEEVGGLVYLAELAQAVPHAAHAQHYAEIVRGHAQARGLISASTETLREAYDVTTDRKEALHRAEERIFAIRDDCARTTSAVDLSDVLHEELVRIDERSKGTSMGVMTGLRDLDRKTHGLRAGELTILAARPGMGKTALALNICDTVAISSLTPTLLVSLEMSKYEVVDRLLSGRAQVSGSRIRSGELSAEERRLLVEASAEMGSAPLVIDDASSSTLTEIHAVARRIKRRKGLGLLVIDYLQLIEPDDSRVPRHEQVSKISRRLKGMAKELSVPVICLAQLNRQTESAGGNLPRLSHLRESGAIEQDADLVLFIHREEYYQTSEEERARCAGQAQLLIAKQRNGPTGQINLEWRSGYSRFENCDEEPAAPQRRKRQVAQRVSQFDDFNNR